MSDSDDIMLMGKNPNFLGAWDLYDEPGKTITVTIQSITNESVQNAGKTDVVTVCHFVEPVKPMILNLTNRKIIANLYMTKSASSLAGKRITIGFDKVKAFGAIHNALRVRPVVPSSVNPSQQVKILCQKCGKYIAPAYGRTPSQLAEHTRAKYGMALCLDCATKAAAELEQTEKQMQNEGKGDEKNED